MVILMVETLILDFLTSELPRLKYEFFPLKSIAYIVNFGNLPRLPGGTRTDEITKSYKRGWSIEEKSIRVCIVIYINIIYVYILYKLLILLGLKFTSPEVNLGNFPAVRRKYLYF